MTSTQRPRSEGTRSHRHAHCLNGNRDPHRTGTSGLRVRKGRAGRPHDCGRVHARAGAAPYVGTLRRAGAARGSQPGAAGRGRGRAGCRWTRHGGGGCGQGAWDRADRMPVCGAGDLCGVRRSRSPCLLRGVGAMCGAVARRTAEVELWERSSDLTTDAGDRSPVHAGRRVRGAGRSGHETMIATRRGRMQGVPARVPPCETERESAPSTPVGEPKRALPQVSWVAFRRG